MCGIFGQFGGLQVPAQVAETLSALLSHRGPDDQGFEQGPGWALGFRRLSILDLSPAGHQPMHSPDGRYWLVFNGEIYNFVELRNELERQGERFTSGSDTEVLLRILMRDGVDGLRRANGMYACAFVDTVARTFLLARDRLGVKPLYYRQEGPALRFASELKALLAWPGASHSLDERAVVTYLSLGYVPGDMCIFQGYRKLAPGHVLTGSLDDPAAAIPFAYWQVTINDEPGDGALKGAALDELAALLGDAVQIRLRSDVPVGVFLSGGLDSGLVAALAGKATGARPLALTVSFEDEEYDEALLARASAEWAGLEHRIVPQRPAGLADIDRLAWYFDEPFGDPSALPTFALCEAAAEHAVVYLSGDGGDEAFGGYRRYIEMQRHHWMSALPRMVTGAMTLAANLAPPLSIQRYRLLKLGLPDAGMAAAFDELPHDPAIAMALHSDLKPLFARASAPLWASWKNTHGRTLTARQQLLDYDLYLPDDVLVKVDRASMAHSLEVRSPFLDYRLVEWAGRQPRRSLVNHTLGKLPIRALGRELLPPTVLAGGKRGFGVPLDRWFREPEGVNFLLTRLLSPEAARFNFWDQPGMAGLIAAHQRGSTRALGTLFWRMLMFDAWARQYLGDRAFLAGPPRAVPVRNEPGWAEFR